MAPAYLTFLVIRSRLIQCGSKKERKGKKGQSPLLVLVFSNSFFFFSSDFPFFRTLSVLLLFISRDVRRHLPTTVHIVSLLYSLGLVVR